MAKNKKDVPEVIDLSGLLEPSNDRRSLAAQCRKNPFLRKKVVEYVRGSPIAADIQALLENSGVEIDGKRENVILQETVFAIGALTLTATAMHTVDAMLAQTRASGHPDDCGMPGCPVQILTSDDHPIHKLERLRTELDNVASSEHLPSLVNYNRTAVRVGEA